MQRRFWNGSCDIATKLNSSENNNISKRHNVTLIKNNIFFQETFFNEEEFPRSFTKGSYEGFWWAFVTMTTVG